MVELDRKWGWPVRLYLVQHGEAVAASVDPERPLSLRGKRDVEGLGEILQAAGVTVHSVFHSGKLRAWQTAEALAPPLNAHRPLAVLSGLAPTDPVPAVISEIAQWADDSLVVGHQPFMGRLVSMLLTGHEEAARLAFVPGAAVCVTRDDHGRWALSWMLPPMLAHVPARKSRRPALGS
jgi:phosphohistidine phosphatase